MCSVCLSIIPLVWVDRSKRFDSSFSIANCTSDRVRNREMVRGTDRDYK